MPSGAAALGRGDHEKGRAEDRPYERPGDAGVPAARRAWLEDVRRRHAAPDLLLALLAYRIYVEPNRAGHEPKGTLEPRTGGGVRHGEGAR